VFRCPFCYLTAFTIGGNKSALTIGHKSILTITSQSYDNKSILTALTIGGNKSIQVLRATTNSNGPYNPFKSILTAGNKSILTALTVHSSQF
jgi:hypothetical protein